MNEPTGDVCPCGLPLHYSDNYLRLMVEDLIATHGACVRIVTPLGVWQVPRHYIALHGLASQDIPYFAKRYGWEKQE